MSYAPRHTNVHPSGFGSGYSNTSTSNTNTNTSFLRQPGQTQTQTQTQSALQTRINAKRAELENLLQLRDLSANLANQLSTLEQKLGTLKDGAHSVALVLANWENVLRAINLAAMKVPIPKDQTENENEDDDENGKQTENGDENTNGNTRAQELPVPLVRIPLQQMEPPVGG
ncbi:DASH complex subunit dad2 [Exophiala xenobiotica]